MVNKLARVVSSEASPIAGPTHSAEDKKRMRRYRAEDALRTLTRAEEIRADKELMGDIRALAKEQMKTLKEFA